MRRGVAVLAAAFLFLTVIGPVAASSGGTNAVHYYLSLGDSLAAGEQPIGDPANGYRTAAGYADQLYQLAKSHYPKLQHVKLGCPGGETTVTFINGGVCPFEYGSQLATTVEFLHAHARYTSLITIDIGWNDIDHTATPCILGGGDPASCMVPGLTAIGTNLPVILAALREAAPGVPIVGMNMYDPFLGMWLTGPAGQAFAGLSVGLAQTANATEAAVYGLFSVPVADVETAFRTTDWTLVPFPAPSGAVPRNVATICALTWVCSAGNNHANADGYGVIATAFADVLWP